MVNLAQTIFNAAENWAYQIAGKIGAWMTRQLCFILGNTSGTCVAQRDDAAFTVSLSPLAAVLASP